MKIFRHGIILTVILGVFLVTCNNFFHDLIPPDGDRITYFEVDGQIGSAVIEANSVRVTVAKGTETHSLVPRVGISHMASIIPVTLDYVKAAFPDTDLVKETLGLYQTQDLAGYVEDLIRRTPGFNVPDLNLPIDFSAPAKFFVVSALGTMREYTIYVEEDSGEPKLLNLRFSKYDNAELVSDAICYVYEASHTVYASAVYPVEMSTLSYKLIPSFEILGDSVFVDGVEVRSGIDAIQFNQFMGIQTKTITVNRDGESVDYTLTINFSEDPDTIRSITDFRFTKEINSSIVTTAVASIVNNENTGTITIQVFYSGAQPSYLTPSFVTPGTASVSGIQQYSGVNGHDFSSPLEYRVVSRSGQYVRTYTVRTEFINISGEMPRMLSFNFSQRLNHELVKDTSGSIGDDVIMIDAYYSGVSAPQTLVPEFTAQGIVTVSGSVQVSGASGQNFSRQIKYTVTHPEIGDLKKDYWVQTHLARDTSNDASITSFGFYPADNTGLADEISGRIDQGTGKISVYAPVGSGVTTRVMIPRFTAEGQVSVNGVIQTSGASGLMFDTPVTYNVISANGNNRRDYVVTVRELQSTIYVNQNAVLGENDGTSWADAFTNLKDACEAAALFQEDIPKEIWIVAGTYKPTDTGNREEYFRLVPNTSYIGGFAGNETAKNQRNTAANKVTISGNLGGVYSNNLFGAFNGTSSATVNGDLAFENIDFTEARATLSGNRANGAAINATLSSAWELRINQCNFTDFQSNGDGGAIIVESRYITITNSVITNTKGGNGGAVYLAARGNINIYNLRTSNTESTSISYDPFAGGGGSIFLSGTGNKTLSNVTIDNATTVGNGGGIFDIDGHLTMIDSVITNTKAGSSGGAVYIGNVYISDIDINVDFSNVTTSNTEAKNGDGGSIYLSGSGNKTLSHVTIDNARASSYGGGIYSSGTTLTMTDSVITNTKGSYGGAVWSSDSNVYFSNVTTSNTEATGTSTSYGGGSLCLSGAGNKTLSNVNIDNTTASSRGGGIYDSGGTLTITDSVIRNTKGSNGGAVFSSSSSVNFSNLTTSNTEAISYGGSLCLSGTGNKTLSNVNIDIATVIFDGGTLFANGGGIYSSGGTLTITDSVITNTSGWNGGAVYSSSNVIFSNLTTSNTEVDDYFYGGSLYLSGTGNNYLYNVNIDNATAGSGGGIYSTGGTLTITDSVIRNTKAARSSGGGLYLSGTGNKTLYNVNIDNATANNDLYSFGGGIYSSGGTLTITDSVIRNTKGSSGGAVHSSSNVDFYNLKTNNTEATNGSGGSLSLSGSGTLSNVTIDNATATRYGGGGIHSSGEITMKDSVITNTKINSSQGGGVYVSSNSFTMDGGTISGNNGSYSGGGVYVNNNGTFIMNSGNISGNNALSGGGVGVAGTFVMSGGTISNNVSEAQGGGVSTYNYDTSFFIMSGGTITGNTAGSSGGGVYLNSLSTFQQTGGTVSGNTAPNGANVYP